jgi:hypothetical protein
MRIQKAPGAVPIDRLKQRNLEIEEVWSVESVKPCHRHPPWLPDRGLASQKRHIRQVSDTSKPSQIGDEDLSSPDLTVDSKTRAVERQTDERIFPAVLGQHGGDVGMVVLHANPR